MLVGGVGCDPLVAVGGAAWGNGLLGEHADARTSTTTVTGRSNRRRNMLHLHVIWITVIGITFWTGRLPSGELPAFLRTPRDRWERL